MLYGADALWGLQIGISTSFTYFAAMNQNGSKTGERDSQIGVVGLPLLGNARTALGAPYHYQLSCAYTAVARVDSDEQ